jgi:hypothetical protein
MGFFFRVLSFLALMAAILSGTVDAVRSVSEAALVMTPLGTAIGSVSVSGLDFIEGLERPGGRFDAFLPAFRWFLSQPAFGVFLIAALLLWMLGYRSKRRQPKRRGMA